jgi:hypothetical protein
MKNYLKVFAIIVVFAASACTSDTPEIKSPCVGAAGSPCERRNPNQQAA